MSDVAVFTGVVLKLTVVCKVLTPPCFAVFTDCRRYMSYCLSTIVRIRVPHTESFLVWILLF
jgi:hypothetical protein